VQGAHAASLEHTLLPLLLLPLLLLLLLLPLLLLLLLLPLLLLLLLLCQVEEPAKRKGGVMLGSVQELVDKLHKEAKVI
jgi:hypothetical protein